MTNSCKAFHYVVENDECGKIATAAGISLADFYRWNPAVGNACTTMWLNTYVCIAVL
jgi:hypothetical protein